MSTLFILIGISVSVDETQAIKLNKCIQFAKANQYGVLLFLFPF
jgi:hypothetical protein